MGNYATQSSFKWNKSEGIPKSNVFANNRVDAIQEKLDRFFTKPDIAGLCWMSLLPVLRKLTGKTIKELFFIEPSAGDGVFYDLLPKGQDRRMGIDIAPLRDEFVKRDFLKWDYRPFSCPGKDIVIVGNPPFGTRGDLAVQFLNKAASIADTVAFIVPVIFRKYFIHKQIVRGLRWIYSTDLPRNSFRTKKKTDYEVNTEFQIWTRLPTEYKDRRLSVPPPIAHKHFEMWQYNNTKEMLKVFENNFDFAVPCQGWQDYTRKETDPRNCEKQKQWILFNPHGRIIRERLYQIDFPALAMKNTTSIPGFRKGDIVREYSCLYD